MAPFGKGSRDEAERDFGGIGTAAAPRRRDAEAGHEGRCRRQGVAGVAGVGWPVAEGGTGRRGQGAGRQACARQAAEVEPRPATATAGNAGARPDASRLRHRTVDALARGRGGPPPLGRELPPQPGVADPRRVGLELPEAAVPRPRAGRGGNRPLAAGGMATHKKTPSKPAGACCSWTRRA